MTVAELFISIGVTGATKTKETLVDTRKGLNETASSALATKAAIIGVLYGLERLVETSNRAGADLQQFGNFTGLSAEKLQRYAYAGRQFGASAEEIKGSIIGVQGAMAKLETTGQGPAGMWVVGRETGGIDKSRLRDTFYMMDKLQQFARTTKLPTAIANEALSSFGLSQGTIAAMRKNAFNPKLMGQANIYSDKESEGLARMNVAWGNLSDRIQKAIGHLNSKHGGQLIKDIDHITKAVLGLVDAFLTLANNLKFFEAIAKAFEGWGMIIKSITGTVNDFNKEGIVGGTTKTLGAVGNNIKEAFNVADYLTGAPDRRVQDMLDKADRAAAAKTFMRDHGLSAAPSGGGSPVSQTNNFYGVKNARDTVPDLKRATSDSVRQSQALRRKH